MSKKNRFSLAFGMGAATAAAYLLAVRPWHLSWGAGKTEIARSLPGDDLVPNPRVNATHAVTVSAPASAIWPWLVQIGEGRGGFYSYTWIEKMMGANIDNSERILPEFQQLKVGDQVPFYENSGPPVAAIEPGRYLVLGGRIDAQSEPPFQLKNAPPEAFFAMSWTFYLDPVGLHATRLIERFRMDWNPSLQNAIYMFGFLEPGAFVMERKMLLGIKQHAEDAYSTLV